MGRWEPGAETRLREAAFELFVQDGFAHVTIEQIAEAAGVTARTFFRHFPTKEDVVFSDEKLIIEDLTGSIRNASPVESPFGLLAVALKTLAETFEPNRRGLVLRAHIIKAESALRERELLKQHQIATALVDEFSGRGISQRRAAVLAGVGMAVFQVTFDAWTTDGGRTTLASRIEQALGEVAQDLNSRISK